MRILATGFEPFGGEEVNPSWMAVSRLSEDVKGAEIIKKQLPVVYFRALEVLEGYIKEYRPDVVLLTGQAGGSDAVRIERVGINLCEGRIPDNAGIKLVGEPIDPEGPAAYFSTFPFRAMLARAEETGVPVRFSYSAGTYLCNHVLYGALRMAELRYPGMRAGFIHVPYLPGQVTDKPEGTPSMELDDIVRAIDACVAAMAGNN